MEEFAFDAFISYSHRDMKWGRWLQRKLESFPIPREKGQRGDMRGKLRIFPESGIGKLPVPDRHLFAKQRRFPLGQRGDQLLLLPGPREPHHPFYRFRRTKQRGSVAGVLSARSPQRWGGRATGGQYS